MLSKLLTILALMTWKTPIIRTLLLLWNLMMICFYLMFRETSNWRFWLDEPLARTTLGLKKRDNLIPNLFPVFSLLFLLLFFQSYDLRKKIYVGIVWEFQTIVRLKILCVALNPMLFVLLKLNMILITRFAFVIGSLKLGVGLQSHLLASMVESLFSGIAPLEELHPSLQPACPSN